MACCWWMVFQVRCWTVVESAFLVRVVLFPFPQALVLFALCWTVLSPGCLAMVPCWGVGLSVLPSDLPLLSVVGCTSV